MVESVIVNEEVDPDDKKEIPLEKRTEQPVAEVQEEVNEVAEV